jgi:hypothetical protein
MAGNNSTVGLETITFTDNMSFDGTERGGAMTTNGQLWIGSTIGRHVKLGSLSSPDGSVTIGYSSPNITLQAGASIPTTFIENTGSAVPAANTLNILGTIVAAGTNPLTTIGAASTVTIQTQYSQALAAADGTKVGLSNFDSTSFAVSATGFVTLTGGGGFTWNDVSGAFSPLKNNGYFITGTATGTLPASPSQGDTIKFFVDHASQVLTIDAPGTQIIRLGTTVSSAGGTMTSTLQGDSVELVYRDSDTCWCAIAGFTGTWIGA